MYKHIITLLLMSCMVFPAAAQDVQLRPDHPDRHIVVKGDTLWDISAKFLKDPWLWPKVWKMNRAQIKNPHLIYPGDVVLLDLSSGDPQLRLLRETVTLEPGIREEPLEKEAVPTIAPNVIAPFLTQPLIIETDEEDEGAIIIGAKDNRVAMGPGSKIYIDEMQEETGRFWSIYRNGKTLTDPITKEALGIEAVYLGDAKVLQYGSPATAEITRANQEIFTKDKLVVAPEELTTSFVPRSPEADIKGHILSMYGSLNEGARNSIITINRGSNHGLEPGHVLAIYREGQLVKNPKYKKESKESKLKELNFKTRKNEDGLTELNVDRDRNNAPDPSMIKLPNERVGLMMVFRTFDRISYALVMQASEPINTLDLVQTP
jgi:hypothetical protein